MGPWSSAHRSPFLLLLLLLLSAWGGPTTEASSTVDCVVAVEGAADEATRCPCGDDGNGCPYCAHAGIQSLADAPIVLPDGCNRLDLSNNELATLPAGAFDALADFRNLDLRGNALHCPRPSICSAGYADCEQGCAACWEFATPCAGHGVCSDGASGDGSCACEEGFASSDCSSGAFGGEGGRRRLSDWQCNGRGALQGNGTCDCEAGWLPSGGQAIVEHAGKWCSRGAQQSGLDTAEACKQGCANDADCKYATFIASTSNCYFSSACDFLQNRLGTTCVPSRSQ